MSKQLPKMYQNKINKTMNNTQTIFSTINKTDDNIRSNKYPSISINKKINNIFSSYDYVYKADVTIVTDNDKLRKRIIARDNNNLITIDNEYIPISIVRDIYK